MITIVGSSPQAYQMRHLAQQLAGVNARVLIAGETGVGKSLTARVIHQLGRPGLPLVTVNCGAIPRELAEATIFGHTRGAFTGAYQDNPGMVGSAGAGTLFLDQVETMPLSIQPLLLRLLEEGEYERVGESRIRSLQARVIAATNMDPEEAVEKGLLREDLYYRLNIMRMDVPPLRERRVDVGLLADYFLEENRVEGQPPREFSSSARRSMTNYSWPGNLRELRSAVERILFSAPDVRVLENEHVEPFLTARKKSALTETLPQPELPSVVEENNTPDFQTTFRTVVAELQEKQPSVQAVLNEVEREFIRYLLNKNKWNRVKTAKQVGLSYKTLLSRITTYDLKPQA